MNTSQPASPAPQQRRRRSLVQRIVRTRTAYRLVAGLSRLCIRLVQWAGPDRSAGVISFLCRKLVAPLVKETRLADANIAAAFPELDKAARKKIVDGVWDNLARTITEYVHLDEIASREPGMAEDAPIVARGIENLLSLVDGRPAIVFSAHLANWELTAVVAARYGFKVTALYRPPANFAIAQDLLERRRQLMGPLVANAEGATMELIAALGRGEHLGLLIDQRRDHGVLVPFFGRPAYTNPLAAKLARAVDCPVYGARSVRLPDGRFMLEMTPALDLPRDTDGKIDVLGATAMMTSVVEGWVREHPEQWLWLHDRWRLRAPRRPRQPKKRPALGPTPPPASDAGPVLAEGDRSPATSVPSEKIKLAS